jgi:CRISPR-associated protein Csc1
MELYRVDLILQDYLFFATTERGKVAETGPFIHNYALTYALGWAVSPWHNDTQKPRYREELREVGRRYITPAKLLYGGTLVSQYNTLSESYSLGKGQSIGYPDWGFVKCFRPGSRFRFYVISAAPVELPRYLRLGKFMAKARLAITQITNPVYKAQAPTEPHEGENTVERPLLNWDDLAPTARPMVYDILVSALPTRLVDNPIFDAADGSYLAATFPDERRIVYLPLQIGYLGENLCASW